MVSVRRPITGNENQGIGPLPGIDSRAQIRTTTLIWSILTKCGKVIGILFAEYTQPILALFAVIGFFGNTDFNIASL